MMEPDKNPTDGLFPTNYQPTRAHSLWSSQPAGTSSSGATSAELGPRRPSHQPSDNSHRRKLSLSLNPGSFNLSSSQPSPGEGSLNPFATIRRRRESVPEVSTTNLSAKGTPTKVDKGKLETRKLLSHLLDQLRTAIAAAPNPFGPPPPRAKGKGKAYDTDTDDELADDIARQARQARRANKGPDWGEATFELMAQLRDVLSVSDKKGWNLFSNSDEPIPGSPSDGRTSPPSPSRARFLRTNSGGNSPTRHPAEAALTTGSMLFAATVALLADVSLLASEPLPAYRPKRPPLSLQSITLDVAAVLVHCMRGRPQETAEIGLAVLSSLEGWGEAIKGRVLGFYQAVISDSLEALQRRRRNQQHHLRPDLRHTVRSSRTSKGFRTGPVPPVAIQVDGPTEVLQDVAEGVDADSRRPSLATADITRRARSSTHAGDQPLTVYQLGSLVGPLLSIGLGNVSPIKSSLDTVYRLHRLLETLVKLKDDLYLDVLDVIAYGNATARQGALSMLATYWPKAIGQPRSAPPFPRIDYRDDVKRMETGSNRLPLPASERVAHVLPWRFSGQSAGHHSLTPSAASSPQPPFTSPNPSLSSPREGAHPCSECGQPVRGFGLLALTGAFEAVHLHCFGPRAGWPVSEYVDSSGQGRVAMPRFSVVGGSHRANIVPADGPKPALSRIPEPVITLGRHRFQLVNLFSLLLCFVCRKPLWGTTLQGYKCSSCRHFAHHDCLTGHGGLEPSVPPCQAQDSAPMAEITIDHDVLRKDFLAYYREIVFNEEQLRKLTYEEVGVFQAVLWTQQQLLEAGLASSTIVIDQVGPTKHAREAIDKFELQYLVKLYAAVQPTLQSSVAYDEFADMHDNQSFEVQPGLDFFCLPLLIFTTALARSPAEDAHHDLLSTGPADDRDAYEGGASGGQCFDELELSLLQDVLARDLNLRSIPAAKLLLEHLLHLGLLERKDGRLALFPAGQATSTATSPPLSTSIVFPLPFLIDPSPSVEALVTAIESCLTDQDLSVQEAGLLLLVRRCWPSPFASAYALARLTRAVLNWLLDDSVLFVAAVEQAAHEAARYASPPTNGRQEMGAGAGVHVKLKAELTARLAGRWLKALHDQDEGAYADCLFEQTATIAASSRKADQFVGGQEDRQRTDQDLVSEHTVAFTELLLKHMIKLHEFGVVFTTFEDLFSRWLDEVAATWQTLSRDDVPLSFRSLVRLFATTENSFTLHKRNGSTPNLFGSPVPMPGFQNDRAADVMVDPWLVLIKTANEAEGGLRRAVRWLRILAQSGVDVSVETLEHLVVLSQNEGVDLAVAVDLAEAIFASAWSAKLNRPGLAHVASSLYSSRAGSIGTILMRNRADMDVALLLMRKTLGAFLLTLGCPPETVVHLGFSSAGEAKALGSNRKRGSFFVAGVKEVWCDAQLIVDLTDHAQVAGVGRVRAMIANFLFGLLAGKEAIGTATQVIKVGSTKLAPCVFSLFHPDQGGLTDQRIKLLLTILSVDGAAVHQHLQAVCSHPDWEHRFTLLDQLFLIITELHIPVSGNTPPHSLANFFPIVARFFGFTADPDESVRTKVSVLIRALRPSHFATIARALQVRFDNGVTSERREICAFLTSVRAILPTWQVLSWATLLEALYHIETDSITSAYGDTNAAEDELWLELVHLAMMMVAEGTEVNSPSTLIKIKYHALKFIGFSDVSLNGAGTGVGRGALEIRFGRAVPEPGPSFAVILTTLKRVLDCSRQLVEHKLTQDKAAVAVGSKVNPLVGAAFVDVIPSIVLAGTPLDRLDYGQLEDLLESLVIILYKHDIEGDVRLVDGVVTSVRAVTDLLLRDTTTHDHELLILTIASTLLSRYEHLTKPIAVHQILVISQLVAQHPDDTIVALASSFLTTAFTRFGGQGLFPLLFRSVDEFTEADLADKLLEAWWLILRDGPSLADRHTSAGQEMRLRESPLFEAFQQTALPLRAVAASLTKYARQAHPADWTLDLLKQLLVYLDRMLRLTAEADGGAEGWDPNATLELADLVWRAQPRHAGPLLDQLAGLVEAWVPRYVLKVETVKALVAPVGQRKLEGAFGVVVGAVNEALSDGLKGREGVQLGTIGALLETLLADCGPLPTRSAVRTHSPSSGWNQLLADDPPRFAEEGAAYLRRCFETGWAKYSRDIFDVTRQAGDLVLLCIRIDPTCWTAVLGRESPSTLRTVNILLLCELSNPSPSSSLLEHLVAIATATSLSLRHCIRGPQHAALSLALVAELVSQVFANVRLCQLLAGRRADGGRGMMEGYWVAVGAVCESVLGQVEVEGEMQPAEALVWSSFSDLIIWLHQAGSPLVLVHGSGWSGLLENLPRSNGSKFSKALASFADPPPRLSDEQLVAGVVSEVYVASKLRAQVLMS